MNNETQHTVETWEESEHIHETPNVANVVSPFYARIFKYSGPIRRVIADVFGDSEKEVKERSALIASAPSLLKENQELKAENEKLIKMLDWLSGRVDRITREMINETLSNKEVLRGKI